MTIKKIHFHLGPHKTGSSAIQRALRENEEILSADFGLTTIRTPLLGRAAQLLIADRVREAVQTLTKISELCAQAEGDCILSCEDLCGAIPGTRGNRGLYPLLGPNLDVLERTFSGYDCYYYFFLRDPDDWAFSAYVQNLKHRQRFSRFEDFAAFLHKDGLWDAVIAKPLQTFGHRFVTIDYPSDTKQSATRCLLAAIPGQEDKNVNVIREAAVNLAPGQNDVALMERINRSGASPEAKRQAKLSLSAFDEHSVPADKPANADWYAPPARPDDLPKVLKPLWQRVENRVSSQDQPNLMPGTDFDLRPLRNLLVEAEGDMPDVGRGNMTDQARILTYRFQGQAEICLLLGLTISYLRRETPHTKHAAILFQRLWTEEYKILLGLLPTRWLISSFQTFLDHGINEQQKIIGSGAYFYANMLKAYETERAFEGLAPDAIYPQKLPRTKSGFAGLDRFKLGGSDLILNTNALLLEISARDQVAGRVVREFLARAKAAQTIFSRMDKSRQAHGIDIKQFSNCWSFFDEP